MLAVFVEPASVNKCAYKLLGAVCPVAPTRYRNVGVLPDVAFNRVPRGEMPETFKRAYGRDLADAEQIDQMQKLRVFDGAAFHGSTGCDRIIG